MKVLQTFALPLGYGTGHKKSGRRDSDSRPPPWQGGALPTELLPQKNGAGRNRTTDTEIFSLLLYLLSYRAIKAIRKGLEPSTSSVTGWHSKPTELPDHISGSNRARTCDPLLVRQMLSQLSYAPSGSCLRCRRIDDFDIILHYRAFVNTFWKFSSVNCMLRIFTRIYRFNSTIPSRPLASIAPIRRSNLSLYRRMPYIVISTIRPPCRTGNTTTPSSTVSAFML